MSTEEPDSENITTEFRRRAKLVTISMVGGMATVLFMGWFAAYALTKLHNDLISLLAVVLFLGTSASWVYVLLRVWKCPACDVLLKIYPWWHGEKIHCPSCGVRLR